VASLPIFVFALLAGMKGRGASRNTSITLSKGVLSIKIISFPQVAGCSQHLTTGSDLMGFINMQTTERFMLGYLDREVGHTFRLYRAVLLEISL